MNRREHKRKPTSFNQDICVLRNGKEIRNIDLIQNGRDQADIFDMTEEELKEAKLVINNAYGNQKMLDEAKTLRGAVENYENLMKKWESMPIAIKRKFNNDPKEFANNGEEWLKAEIAKIEKEQQKQQQKQPEAEDKKGE